MENSTDYTFGGADNLPQFIPAGDSIFEVIEVETGISAGGKTRGSRTIALKLKLEPSNVHVYERLICAPSTSWRIDTFVRSTGITCPEKEIPEGLKQGEEYKLIGLRGWATLMVDEYEGKKRNKVAVWLTNKEKLPRKPWPTQEKAEDDQEVPF